MSNFQRAFWIVLLATAYFATPSRAWAGEEKLIVRQQGSAIEFVLSGTMSCLVPPAGFVGSPSVDSSGFLFEIRSQIFVGVCPPPVGPPPAPDPFSLSVVVAEPLADGEYVVRWRYTGSPLVPGPFVASFRIANGRLATSSPVPGWSATLGMWMVAVIVMLGARNLGSRRRS